MIHFWKEEAVQAVNKSKNAKNMEGQKPEQALVQIHVNYPEISVILSLSSLSPYLMMVLVFFLHTVGPALGMSELGCCPGY